MVPATVISNSHELSGKQPRQTNGNCCVAQCKCKIDIDEMAENGESKRSINLRFDCEAENAMLNGRHEYFIVNSRQVIQVIHYGNAVGVCVCVFDVKWKFLVSPIGKRCKTSNNALSIIYDHSEALMRRADGSAAVKLLWRVIIKQKEFL